MNKLIEKINSDDLIPEPNFKRIDLLKKFPFLKKIVKLRAFQFLVTVPTLFVFLIILFAGFWGLPI